MPTRNRIDETPRDVLSAVLLTMVNGETSPAAIGRTVSRKHEGRDDVSKGPRYWERLVQDIKERIAGVPNQDKILDTPFAWHRIDEFGIAWAASEFLLEMWAYVQLFEFDFAHIFHLPLRSPPSGRVARWWCRVREAIPGATKLDIKIWSDALTRGELLKDYLGITEDIDGLSACLAYKPWVDQEHGFRYSRAIRHGMIRSLPTWDLFEEIEQRERIDRIIGAKGASQSHLLYTDGLPPGQAFWESMSSQQGIAVMITKDQDLVRNIELLKTRYREDTE